MLRGRVLGGPHETHLAGTLTEESLATLLFFLAPTARLVTRDDSVQTLPNPHSLPASVLKSRPFLSRPPSHTCFISGGSASDATTGCENGGISCLSTVSVLLTMLLRALVCSLVVGLTFASNNGLCTVYEPFKVSPDNAKVWRFNIFLIF